ncbi:MAG: glycoside hydrolase family 16 protein [Ferruginibacter sp.]
MQNSFKMFSIIPLLCATLFACTEKKEIPPVIPVEPPTDKNWSFETTPMWEDNFSATGAPDLTKWGYDVGGSGWGNNELQFYTNNGNARQENGNLVIEVKKENNSGREYTSARMVSKGKGDFLYGRIEVRAKLPRGRGTWPAIWMLSTDWQYGDWPASGEIDIMEHVGYDPNKIHSSVHTTAFNHTRNTQKTAFKMVPDAMDAFHIYRIDWTPYSIKSFIDGEQYFEFVNQGTGFTVWPFDKAQHLLLNVAVGGNWGGVQGVDNTIFPVKFEIDYVKVYKLIP